MGHLDDMEVELTPQYNRDAEQSVIGGLLIDNSGLDRISSQISASDFYLDCHRIIFPIIEKLIADGRAADIITVAEELDSRGLNAQVERSCGCKVLQYLLMLYQNVPSAANIAIYAKIVREKSILRSIWCAANEIMLDVRNTNGRTSREILDFAQSKLMAISDGNEKSGTGFSVIAPILTGVVEKIEELHQRPGDDDVIGLPTGFVDLDAKTSGFQNGDLIIIAGRPSMGKTAFAINIGEYASLKRNAKVGIFSMEMSSAQITMRMLASAAGVHHLRVRTGRLYDNDWSKLADGVGKLSPAPIYIDETGSLSALELRSRARKLHRECGGLDLLIIDYLQLMEGGDASENRANQVAEISRSLKGLAKELNIPVVALSQLNRSVESRPNKRPMMSDLRESGAIEQDADVILFVYRDEVYNPTSENKGKAEIIIGKQRNGPIGTVLLTFRNEVTRFENYAETSRYGEAAA